MSTIGIVSIAFGVVSVVSRSYAAIAPAAALDWLRNITGTNRPLRIAGIVGTSLGGVLVWAGNSDDSGLANFLLVIGWIMVGVCAALMVLFPAAYRGHNPIYCIVIHLGSPPFYALEDQSSAPFSV